MSQVTCSGSIPNPVCAKLKKIELQKVQIQHRDFHPQIRTLVLFLQLSYTFSVLWT